MIGAGQKPFSPLSDFAAILFSYQQSERVPSHMIRGGHVTRAEAAPLKPWLLTCCGRIFQQLFSLHHKLDRLW